MDMNLAVVILPVSDVDRAKAFYVDQLGFAADDDAAPTPEFRIVQLTPPGSACSIAVGTGLTATKPAGPAQGLRLVVADIDAVRSELTGCGVDVTGVDDRPWGRFAWFSDLDGTGWELNQAPSGS